MFFDAKYDKSMRYGEGGLRLNGIFKNEIEGKPLISIVTVVFNGGNFLEQTIKSVLLQAYDNVEYIIIDGGSKDETVNIIKKYENLIDYWVSESDCGMYDALNKGFSLARGSIYGWINSDDVYLPGAFENVVKSMVNHSLDWVTGIPSTIDKYGNFRSIEFPFFYPRYLIRNGFFRGDSLGFIQQESTFFSSKLYWKSPLNRDFKLAGDYFLWSDFAKTTYLKTIKTVLSSFRVHENQKSVDMSGYLAECDKLQASFLISFLRSNFLVRIILKIYLILSINRVLINK